jgi:hypothetical protein
MVREEHYILESDLRALDEALRFSARKARWPEGDSGAEGMPPDEIQQHPVGIVADFKLDELPERMRFLEAQGEELHRVSVGIALVCLILPKRQPLHFLIAARSRMGRADRRVLGLPEPRLRRAPDQLRRGSNAPGGARRDAPGSRP